jgi:hypothetical protein
LTLPSIETRFFRSEVLLDGWELAVSDECAGEIPLVVEVMMESSTRRRKLTKVRFADQ